MKNLLFVVSLSMVGLLNAQIKKEQIEILTNRVDSLNQVVISQNKTINDKNSQITVLNAKISDLQLQIQTFSFKSVKIGTQTWMAENLNVSTFRNGDSIPEAKTNEEWKRAGENQQPAWCYYENDPKNGQKYGKLYNWYAVNDSRGLAPECWHVPSDAEWTTLENQLGDYAGKKMKSTSGWNENGNGTNSSGFSGLPGGYHGLDGTFDLFGGYGSWWSSTENYTDDAWSRYLYYNNGNVYRYSSYKKLGFSVRCLRD